MVKLLLPNCLFAVFVFAQAARQNEKPRNSQPLVGPERYARVPSGIRASIHKRGCQLPATQDGDNGSVPVNFVSGQFSAAGQTDWAALCVIGDLPQALVVWGRARSCPAEIQEGWPLKAKFSEEPAGGLYLKKATPELILRYRKAFEGAGGPRPRITHDGIEVGDEQASLIYYCDSGKWVQLQGND